jgi:predicted nucleic acid-binding protein
VERGERVIVCDLVLAEAYYALQHHYGVPKGDARTMLARFAESGIVETDPADAGQVLHDREGAGLVDRLVHSRHRGIGATTITFERKQGALEGAVRLRVR